MKRYLFNFLEEIISSIKNSPQVLLFLDYDGTLVPICKKPSLAKLSLRGKKLLRTLSGIPRFSIGIISGRSLKEVRRLVGIRDLIYVGNHGFEILFRGTVWIHPEFEYFKSKLKKVAYELKLSTKGVNGIVVEDKKFTVSVHYRNLTGRSPRSVLSIVSEALEPYHETFTVTRGKKVYEVRPRIDWNKGRALLKLSRLLGLKNQPLKIYIGDDQTDEDVFRVLENDDISIRVGYRQASKARYFCKGSGEILRLLEQLTLLKK